MHHIISDGWSMQVLVGELNLLYAAYSRGEDSPLAELPVQYADYAQWQRGRLEAGAFDRDLSYWREALAGAPPALELPTDKPRPPARTGRGSRFSISLPAETGEAVRRLALASSATPFMVLLAAFQLLLAKHAGQREVVVGSPVAGRLRPELEGLIGFFVNTLALRADVSDDPTFLSLRGARARSVLERVRASGGSVRAVG